jgi:hypothetical protein
MSEKDWASVLVGIASVIVSVCSVIVAVSQWKLAHSKLRFEMLDRRIGVKEAVYGLADAYINSGQHPKPEAWARFYRVAYCGRFVYPAEAAI